MVCICNDISQVPKPLYSCLFNKIHLVIFCTGLHNKASCFIVSSFQTGSVHCLDQESSEVHPSFPDLVICNFQMQSYTHCEAIDFFLDGDTDVHRRTSGHLYLNIYFYFVGCWQQKVSVSRK